MADQAGPKSNAGENALLQMDLCVPFPSSRLAEIAFNSLRVDREPKRGGCKKELSVEGRNLNVVFKAEEARTLRVATNSFLDFLVLVSETMEQFDNVE